MQDFTTTHNQSSSVGFRCHQSFATVSTRLWWWLPIKSLTNTIFMWLQCHFYYPFSWEWLVNMPPIWFMDIYGMVFTIPPIFKKNAAVGDGLWRFNQWVSHQPQSSPSEFPGNRTPTKRWPGDWGPSMAAGRISGLKMFVDHTSLGGIISYFIH